MFRKVESVCEINAAGNDATQIHVAATSAELYAIAFIDFFFIFTTHRTTTIAPPRFSDLAASSL